MAPLNFGIWESQVNGATKKLCSARERAGDQYESPAGVLASEPAAGDELERGRTRVRLAGALQGRVRPGPQRHRRAGARGGGAAVELRWCVG